MDHEVTPRPYKICDWLLTSSRDHFSLHQGQSVSVTMEFEVPKRHILGPTLSIDMIQHVLRWERQKRCSNRKKQELMTDKYCYIKLLIIFPGKKEMKTRQDKTREWSDFIISLNHNYLFWPCINKIISTFIFWCMVIPLGPTFGNHLTRGSKAL